MATTEVVKALRISDINIDEVTIGTKKHNKKVPVSFKNKPLVFQTPFLEVRGTLRKTLFPDIYQLDTLFKGDSKQKIHQWYQFIESLETHISDQVVKNGATWFTQKDINIKSLIREIDATNEIYFVKWLVNLESNIFIDEQKKSFNPTNLKDKDCIKLIIEISDLWISENTFCLASVVQKILVKPFFEKIQSEYVFDDSDGIESESNTDDDENNIISLLATEQKTRPQPAKKNDLAQNVQVGNNTIFTKTIEQQNALPYNKSTKEDLIVESNILPRNYQQGNIPSKKIITPSPLQQPKFNPIITNNYEQHNEKNKQQSNSRKEVIQQKNKHDIPQNKNSNQKNKQQSIKNMANPFKSNINPSRNSQKQSALREVFSDLSDDDEINVNMHNIQHFVDEYSPSSDEDEINDDDLDFD